MLHLKRLALIALFIALLYGLRDALSPFLLAFLFAYLCRPLVLRLQQHGMTRLRAIIASFSLIGLGLTFFIFIILPLIGVQFIKLFEQLPHYLIWFKEHVLMRVAHLLRLNAEWNWQGLLDMLQQHAGSLQQLGSRLLGNVLGSASYLIAFFSHLFLVPFIAFYLLRDWDNLFSKLKTLIPPRHAASSLHLIRRCDEVLSGFFQGQFLVMLALGVLYSLGLSLLGLDMALGIGLLAGLVSFVPYLGLIVGMSLALLLAVLQFQDLWHPLGVVLVFSICQSIEGMYLTPKLVGDRTGLHPLAVLFALLAGGQLLGFSGILWALPVAAVMNVFLHHWTREVYLQSAFYRRSGSASDG